MKKLLIFMLVAVMAFSLAACGQKEAPANTEETKTADSDLSYITEKGTLVIGITDYEPMNFKDDSGEWTGFDTEFALLVGEKLGVDVEFVEIDWDNKQNELNSKAVDCIWNGMTLTDEVLASMETTDPYVINAQVVVMASDKVADFADIDSLKELKFAVEAGSAGEAALEENGLDNFTAVAAQSDALMEVASGSADACVIDITMANAMTGEGTSYANLTSGLSLTEEEYGIGFRKGSDAAAAVNDIIKALKEDGSLQKLAEKYELTLVD
ncbi:MAG: transporter substrate-binding domain-containing protein [Clostridia bacterium]|nr:transporter substrate-binding domain-containing protein [Clostridia bacterium]